MPYNKFTNIFGSTVTSSNNILSRFQMISRHSFNTSKSWNFRSRFVLTCRMGQSRDVHLVSYCRPQHDWQINSICRNFLSMHCIRLLTTKETRCGSRRQCSQIILVVCRPQPTMQSVFEKYWEIVLRFFTPWLSPVVSLVSSIFSNFIRLLRRNSSNLAMR